MRDHASFNPTKLKSLRSFDDGAGKPWGYRSTSPPHKNPQRQPPLAVRIPFSLPKGPTSSTFLVGQTLAIRQAVEIVRARRVGVCPQVLACHCVHHMNVRDATETVLHIVSVPPSLDLRDGSRLRSSPPRTAQRGDVSGAIFARTGYSSICHSCLRLVRIVSLRKYHYIIYW